MKNNKALGNCNINAEFFKAASCDNFYEFMSIFFNSLVCNGLPSAWNVLSLTSLFKNKGEKSCADNYRGLAVMNAFAKLFATCVTLKFETIALQNNLRARS